MTFRLITPIETHDGFSVKREDLCDPDVPLSKMRGMMRHLATVSETTIACLDTFRSWNGLCTAVACKRLGKRALLFYPEYKARPRFTPPLQAYARDSWGATLFPVAAGRQGVMLHEVRENVLGMLRLDICEDAYVLPTGLKYRDTVEEVAKQAAPLRGMFDIIVVPTGTGTHLKGVIEGNTGARVIAVLGYTHDEERLRKYVGHDFELVDQGYDYRDIVEIETPFPANPYYETKAWRWMKANLKPHERTLLWNIGGQDYASGLYLQG